MKGRKEGARGRKEGVRNPRKKRGNTPCPTPYRKGFEGSPRMRRTYVVAIALVIT